jgi:hypothetical protein
MVGFLKPKNMGFGPQERSRFLRSKEIILPYGRMNEPVVKKCTNCCRAPQPLKEFINEKERECNTCNKCRNKGKKNDKRPERREAHNELQNEKRYDKAWRAKQLEERPGEFREHNNKVHKNWRAENSEHAKRWYRTHVNPRLDAIKRSATTRGIEWNLTDDEAKVMLVSPCIYCKHIDLEVRVNGIDRLDSGKSYSTENCRPCCKNCNYMKGTFDPRTFITWAKKIAQCDIEFPEITECGEHKKVNRI